MSDRPSRVSRASRASRYSRMRVGADAPGRWVTLQRNQSLTFINPRQAWIIDKGSLEIQGSRFDYGVPVGGRRQLFMLTAGQGVIGVDVSLTPGNQGWLAIAMETVVLRVIDLEQLAIEYMHGYRGAYYSVVHWVSVIGDFMAQGTPPPASALRLPGAGEFEFGKEESFMPARDRSLWIHLDAGELSLLGNENARLTALDGYVLTGGGMWFQVASEVAEIDVRQMELSTEAIESGLATLHRLFAACMEQLARDEEAAELERLKNSAALDRLETEMASQELSQLLQPVEQFPLQDTPLLTAMSVLGSTIGVTIEPPRASEDMNRVNDPIEPIARASHIRHRKILLGPQWWRYDLGPFLAFVGDERTPVAMLPSGLSYDVIDPIERIRKPLTQELKSIIHPDAYVLYRPLPDLMNGFRDLARFTFRGKGRDIAFILLMALLTTAFGMITPRVTSSLVDTAIPAADTSFLVQLAMILCVAGIAGGAFTLLQVMTMVRTSVRTEDAAQSALWDRLLRARPSFFRKFSSGELQHRVEAVSEISRELNTATLRPMFSGVMALLNWLLLWYYSWELAKVALYVGLAVMVIVLIIGRFVRKLSLEFYDAEGDCHGLVIQLVGGVGKLRVAASEQRAFNRWLRYYTRTLRLSLRIQAWKDAMTLINNILVPAATILLFWKAVDLTIDLDIGDPERISIGDFVAFNAAFILYLVGWSDLTNALVQVMDSAAKLHRVRPLLEEEPEVGDGASDPGRLTGRVHLDDVSFRYSEDGPLIIDRVSLDIRPGEYVAFVGSSGSGKSTILRLLLGFETPDKGRVLYDGRDLSGLDTLAVRRQIGTVLQEGRLNSASILDNIANNAKVTLGEVWEAIADAGMTRDIEVMPMGLHTIISEGGGNISGGQRQRLLIARAMVLRPKIFIFDEATSALDNDTQATVSESLDRRECTRIVIAHRLSTIRNADRIFVIDRGRIVQQGTFDELNEQEGLFRNLMARQML